MTAPLRILLVEDSESDAKLIAHELRRDLGRIEFERVDNGAAMRTAMLKEWDVVISDWSMPTFSAPDALALVKELGVDIPFIIVSGTIGEEIAVDAMRAGAKDYVLKDRLARLGPAVEREIRESKEHRERRAAEKALRASEARFARLAETGIVGIIEVDLHGNIYEANEPFLKLLGYSRQDLLFGSLRWADLTPSEWRRLDEDAIEKLKSGGAAPAWEKELLHRDGQRVPILVGMALLDYPKCIAFISDLTERRRVVDALRRSEEQLQHSQKMDAIGRLAGGVAHDFNNLLSVIMAYSEMGIQELLPSEPMRASLEEIRKAAERAAGLTRQLLAFSRHQVLEPKNVDLNELVTGVNKMLFRLIGEDIELRTALAPDLGRIKVDPGQIELVLMNLIVNSRDAMPGGGKLTIRTCNIAISEPEDEASQGLAAGDYVKMEVIDDGMGMDKATQARIFEPFFTTKEMGKGTGLGLATVFGIVQQSNGYIRVESEAGKGAKFEIYFPRLAGAPVEDVTRTLDRASLRGTETVLLVEDEEQIRDLVEMILIKLGYKVLTAANGQEALLLSEKESGRIDLLLTDVVMPRMNGPDLARRLVLFRPTMKVICMSGYTGEPLDQHGLMDSGFSFLPKPLTPEKVARKLREVLSPAPDEP